jgi:AcrR family transcriptional regulator
MATHPSADPITSLTPKAQKTRETILAAALDLFARKGYQATTLRDIAAEAGVSLGLTYRYFAAKEELIIALYDRCADDLVRWAKEELPPGTLAKRFSAAMRADMRELAPFRDGFSTLFQVGLTPGSDTAVLGEKVASVREKVWATFLDVILGSRDAPREPQARDLATALYAAHLMIVLFWLQDRTEGQRATQELIDFAEDLLGRLRLALKLPMTAKILTRFVKIIGPMFGPAELYPNG